MAVLSCKTAIPKGSWEEQLGCFKFTRKVMFDDVVHTAHLDGSQPAIIRTSTATSPQKDALNGAVAQWSKDARDRVTNPVNFTSCQHESLHKSGWVMPTSQVPSTTYTT
jgi:hypothetical protein